MPRRKSNLLPFKTPTEPLATTFYLQEKIIHQPNIPALPGNAGFYNEDDAVKTANLVIQKINAGIMPPSVTEAEIQGIIGDSR